MPLNAKRNNNSSSKKIDLPEIKKGTYTGRVACVVDIGVQPQKDWQTGEDKPAREELIFIFEFSKLRMDVDGESKPRWLTKSFKIVDKYQPDGSYNEWYEKSGLYKQVDPILPDEDDYSSAIGVPIMCQVGHTKSGNPKVITVTPTPEELPVPELENDPVVFDFYDPDIDAYNKLPNWLKTKCKEAVDYEESTLKALLDVAGDDD